MPEYNPITDARDDLACALRYGIITDEITRDRIVRAHQTLLDYTRAGNLSPEYLFAQDRARRESEAHSHSVASANRGTAA